MAANSYRNVFVTNVDELLASGDSLDLGFGQIGILNSKTNQAVTSPTFPNVRGIQIVQGTTNKKLPAGMLFGNESWRSPEIGNDSSIEYKITPGQKAQNRIVTIGYDGVDVTKTMAPRKGKDVKVFITLSGQPIADILAGSNHHPAFWVEEFFLDLPCTDDCTDTCGDTWNCNVVADELIRQMNIRTVAGAIPLVYKEGEGGFLKLTKLTACDTPSGYPTTDCVKYTLEIADLGDQVALGKVQAEYPGLDVTKLSRTGIYTTYQIVDCTGAGVPADYTSNGVVIPNCTDCPSGATSIDEAFLYKVTRNSLTAVTTGTIAAAYSTGYVTGSIVKISEAGVVEQVFTLLSTSDSVVAAAATDTVELIGTRQAICVLPSTTTGWDTGDTCYKAEKTFQLSLKNDKCGTPIPAATLTEYYGTTVTLVETNTSTCTSLYSITVLSDNTGCVDCAGADGVDGEVPHYEFSQPKPYNNSVWTAVEATVTGTGCVCGVKIEAAFVAKDRKECFFEEVTYLSDPLGVYVTSYNPDLRDYSSLCDDSETFPTTIIQEFQLRQGFGSFIADQYKESRFYFNNPWFAKPVMRDAIGYELGVDLQGYYDQHTVTFKKPFTGSGSFSGFGLSQFEEYEFTTYFSQGSPAGDSFRNALNSWILSIGGIPA